jgi:hypothetical protein
MLGEVANYETTKVVGVRLHVSNGLAPRIHVPVLVAPSLIRDRAEEAVAVGAAFLDLEV